MLERASIGQDEFAAPRAFAAPPEKESSPCDDCTFKTTNLCGRLQRSFRSGTGLRLSQAAAKRRQTFQRAGAAVAGLTVLCQGWAIKFMQLPNGRRQALSIIRPGELVSAAAVFEAKHVYSVQALTEIKYAVLDNSLLKQQLTDDASLMETWSRHVVSQLREAQQLLIDLGQRTAEERIAALVVRIARPHLRDDTIAAQIAFPLSQQHVADITGLGAVHTCRVIHSFRRKGLCDFTKGQVDIKDYQSLVRVATGRAVAA